MGFRSMSLAAPFGTSDNNLIQGNLIGVAADGSTPLGNSGNGVLINSGSFNQVGGTVSGQSNIIATNGQDGIRVVTGIGNTVLSNSIHDNAGGGVILVSGGNNSQAAPVLTSAQFFPGTSQVNGSFSVAANTTYLVQFFGNNPASGQGQLLLGGLDVAPQSVAGPVSLTFSFTAPATLPIGSTITAIATVTATPSGSTNPAKGDSSEFSNSVVLVNGAVNPFIVTNTSDSGIGSLRFAIQAANADIANNDTIIFQIPT